MIWFNIKFVVPVDGTTKAPKETMTNNRVYVTLDRFGEVKYISYYDKDNKKKKQIDLQHLHQGMQPHVHHGYEHNENDPPKGATKLSPKEKQMISTVQNVWGKKKNDVWERWKSRH